MGLQTPSSLGVYEVVDDGIQRGPPGPKKKVHDYWGDEDNITKKETGK